MEDIKQLITGYGEEGVRLSGYFNFDKNFPYFLDHQDIGARIKAIVFPIDRASASTKFSVETSMIEIKLVVEEQKNDQRHKSLYQHFWKLRTFNIMIQG